MEITLRAPEPRDLDMLYQLENIPDIWAMSWGEAPVSRQMLWEYLQSYSADIYRDRQLRLIIMAENNEAGCIDITDFDFRNGRAMIGLAILPEKRNQGIATEALQQAMHYCFYTLGVHQLYAIVARSNEISLRLFAKAGFSTSGNLRSWLRKGKSYEDALILQKLN